MQNLITGVIGGILMAFMSLVAFGLFVAGAVVAFAELVGTAGALGIVGAIVLVLVFLIMLIVQAKQRSKPAPVSRGNDLGGMAVGFALGVFDALTRPKDSRK